MNHNIYSLNKNNNKKVKRGKMSYDYGSVKSVYNKRSKKSSNKDEFSFFGYDIPNNSSLPPIDEISFNSDDEVSRDQWVKPSFNIDEELSEDGSITDSDSQHSSSEIITEEGYISDSDIVTYPPSNFSVNPNAILIFGPTGPQGLQGMIGQPGEPGQKGQTGLDGPHGEDGCPGRRGIIGIIGDTGPEISGFYGPTGETGLQGGGPGTYTCELFNKNDMVTSVSVCTDEIIKNTADQYLLLTGSCPPCLDPFDPGNTGGVNMKYFDIQLGIFRAGNFRESDLVNLGNQSTAFGHWTRAEGAGSFAFGYNLSDDTINAGADSSLVFGYTENGGTIQTLSPATASVVYGVALNNGTIQVANGSGSMVLGVAINEGMMQSDGNGSMITGVVSDTGSIMMVANDAIGSKVAGSAFSGGMMIADAGSVNAKIKGNVQDPNSLMKSGTNSISSQISGEVMNGGQMVIGKESISARINGISDNGDMITGNNTVAVKISGMVMDNAQMITGNYSTSNEISGMAIGSGSLLKSGSETNSTNVSGIAMSSGQIVVDKKSIASSAMGMAKDANSMICITTKTIATTAGGVASQGGQLIVDAGTIASSVQGMAEGFGSMLVAEYFTTSSSVHGQATNGAQMVVDKGSIASSISGSSDSQSMMMIGSNTIGTEITGSAANNGMMMVNTGSIASNIGGVVTTSATMMSNNDNIGSSITGYAMNHAQMMIDTNSVATSIDGIAGNTGSIMTIGSNAYGSSLAGGVKSGGMMMADSNAIGTIIQGSASDDGSIIMTGKNSIGNTISGKVTNGGMSIINADTIGASINGQAEMNGLLTIMSNSIGSSVAGYVSNGTTGPINNFSRSNPFKTRFTARSCQVATIEAGGCGSSSKGCAIDQNSLIYVDSNTSGSNSSGMAYKGGQIIVSTGANGAEANGMASGTSGNTGSMIMVEENTEGGYVGGCASNGGIVMIGKNISGSILHGIADTGEHHEIQSDVTNVEGIEGAANFGRNNLSNASYSLVMGCGAVSDTFCSVTQSSGGTGSFTGNVKNVLSADNYETNFVLGTGLVPRLNGPGVVNGELNVIGTNGNYIAQKFISMLDPISLLYTTQLIIPPLMSSGMTLATTPPTPNGIQIYADNPGMLRPPEKFCAKLELMTGVIMGPTGAYGPFGDQGPQGPMGFDGPTGENGPTGPTGPTPMTYMITAPYTGATGLSGFLASPSGTPIPSTGLTKLDTRNESASFYLPNPTPLNNYFTTVELITKRSLPAYVNTDRGSFVLTPTDSIKNLVYTTETWNILNQNNSFYPTVQQGSKLVGTGAIGSARQGYSVALSADGNTMAVGGPLDNSGEGAVWVFIRTGTMWTQQGSKLVGTGAANGASQGWSIALSADGNTLAVGGYADAPIPFTFEGAVWIFTRSGGIWSQQGSKLVGTGAVNPAEQGRSVSLSADGNTLAVGGQRDNTNIGAAWVFTRSGGIWTQQGGKLVGTGNVGTSRQGNAISLSADGNTMAVGGYSDNSVQGAVWIYTRSGTTWTQQGSKLVGTGNIGGADQGYSVSLSADGNTLASGGIRDNGFIGATWIFTRSGTTWIQQGNKLVGANNIGASNQGWAVSLTGDGNTLAVTGPEDNTLVGAVWIYTRSGGNWTQTGPQLIGTGYGGSFPEMGYGVALSGNGNTLALGGPFDFGMGSDGATWIFV